MMSCSVQCEIITQNTMMSTPDVFSQESKMETESIPCSLDEATEPKETIESILNSSDEDELIPCTQRVETIESEDDLIQSSQGTVSLENDNESIDSDSTVGVEREADAAQDMDLSKPEPDIIGKGALREPYSEEEKDEQFREMLRDDPDLANDVKNQQWFKDGDFVNLQMQRTVSRPMDVDDITPRRLEIAHSKVLLPGDSRSWMCPLLFEGQLILFLVDTGSSVSIISKVTYISRFQGHPLLDWFGNICHAAGQNLEVQGCLEGNLQLLQSTLKMDFAIAKIGANEAILGWTFSTGKRCQ